MGILQVRHEDEVVDQPADETPAVVVNDAARRPDPEVLEKPSPRRFTLAYKLKILEEADRCLVPGSLGAMLRREGLYRSHLATWRRQRDAGELSGSSTRKRGRKAKPVNPLSGQIEKLERENNRLRRELEKATMIIDVQKKISILLGIPRRRSTTTGKNHDRRC